MASLLLRSQYQIRDATAADIESLTTILARSFHPVNPYIKEALPDTPKVRDWWRDIFTYCIQSSDEYKILVATATVDSSSAHKEEEVIAVLILHLVAPDQKCGGCWTTYPPTTDHGKAKFTNMIDAMIDYHTRIMLPRKKRHCVVELFGTDHAWKGRGVGGALLRRACEVSDREGDGLEIFVQANGSAAPFYLKMGFRQEERVVMPKGEGEGEYVECMLVRPAKGRVG